MKTMMYLLIATTLVAVAAAPAASALVAPEFSQDGEGKKCVRVFVERKGYTPLDETVCADASVSG